MDAPWLDLQKVIQELHRPGFDLQKVLQEHHRHNAILRGPHWEFPECERCGHLYRVWSTKVQEQSYCGGTYCLR
jgi:hypothetical protein